MRSMIHIPSGEGALVRECRPRHPKTVLAQFDRQGHEHASGWHRYPRAEFRLPDKITITHDVPIVTRKALYQDDTVGKAMRHPDGRLVYIAGGQYLSHGRVSNFWYWHPILGDGTLGPQKSGYGW